jgi:ubiquinone/menaquinone biosynthesis C-methylase UbiE
MVQPLNQVSAEITKLYDEEAKFYDFQYADLKADIDMYIALAKEYGEPVLEVGCGTGRIMIPLAREGFKVTGIDITRSMLDIARRKVCVEKHPAQGRIEIIEADMRNFSLNRKYQMAFIPINSFLHLLTTSEQVSTLNSIGAHLKSGGVLVIDIFKPDLTRPQNVISHVFTKVNPVSGKVASKFVTQTFDFAKQTIQVHSFLDEMSDAGVVKRHVSAFELRYIFRYEMELLLEKTGFKVKEIYGDYDRSPFVSESKRMIFVAEKL